jgi:hypothetical protein
MYYLVILIVLSLAIILLSSSYTSPFYRKLKALQTSDKVNDPICGHQLVLRRHLTGDVDFQLYKNVKCDGNRPVIKSTHDFTRGSMCTGCIRKVFCSNPGCICKKN